MEPTLISSPRRLTSQVLALGLMGAGLLILGGAALALLPGLLGSGVRATLAPGEYTSALPAAVDFPAPRLELTDLDGRAAAMADFRGRWVLVNHWATWCPPCKAEMPVLQAYFEDHRQNGFIIVAIEAGEPVEQVAEYAATVGLTFTVWPGPDQRGMDAFKEEYLPASYLIDPTGQVKLYWSGPISRKMLDKYVTPLLEN
jgi:thiol-disulfide isomerase/thioredoxin